MSTMALFSLGPLEIGVLLVIALLIFGRRLPEVARSVGQSVVQFKKGLSEVETSVRDAGADDKKAIDSKPENTASQSDDAQPAEHKQA